MNKTKTFLIAVAVMSLMACGGNKMERKAEQVAVETETVKTGSDIQGRTYVGVVEEESATSISFSSSGTLTRVYVEEGQAVRAGQLIAELDKTQYRLLEKNVEANRLQHKMKVGENLPTVSAGAVYTYNNLMDEGRGVGMLMATVSVPISGWWGGSHAIKKQRLAYEQARDQMADASQKLVINMNNCWANVETSHKQLAIARKSIEQSEENLRLNNDYYRAGTTTMSDLLDAQSSYQQSRDKYVDAYIDYQQNLLKYRQATGQAVKQDKTEKI